jgi:hypothetical protein
VTREARHRRVSPRRPKLVCGDWWDLRSRSAEMPSGFGTVGPSGTNPAYIYCQNPCDAAPRPPQFELQFKMLNWIWPSRRAPVRVQIAAAPVGPVEPDLNRPAPLLSARRDPFQCSCPPAVNELPRNGACLNWLSYRNPFILRTFRPRWPVSRPAGTGWPRGQRTKEAASQAKSGDRARINAIRREVDYHDAVGRGTICQRCIASRAREMQLIFGDQGRTE